MNNLPFTIEALHEAYAAGAKPEEVVAECHRRIEAVGDPGIFIHLLDAGQVVRVARELGRFDPRSKPLWGIPFVIKDNIDAAGLPTTAACPEFAYVAEHDAFVVHRLRAAGALLIGKTNLDQFATGLVGTRSPYPVPRNTIDPEIVPGGSSSGSAVSVAHGLVTFSLGTDTAGSGRVPAALNNIVGLKPSLGTLSASGVVPACRTLDTVSIFALSVENAWKAYEVAAGFDSSDAYSKNIAIGKLGNVQPHFNIGVPSASTIRFCNDESQAASFGSALELVTDLGGQVIEIDFSPFYEIAELLYHGAWVAERHSVIDRLFEEKPDVIHPVTAAIVGKARELSATDAFRSFYRLKELAREVEPLLKQVDMVAVPSIPTFVTVADIQADPISPNNKLGTYTNFVNLLDMCGIAVPVPARDDGRPGSITLLARSGHDHVIADLARRIHEASNVKLGGTDWKLSSAPLSNTGSGPDELAIAAVGAHMSGLPLNDELTKLGARFLKASSTASNYRLYSLAGGPPFRPGLMLVDDGASIDLEVWALPKSNIGAFLEGIPAPLGLGTVTLENGETVNGFICEAAGLAGATDITAFGGWRNYLASKQAAASA